MKDCLLRFAILVMLRLDSSFACYRHGAKRIRTADFHNAIVALYQLSYSPECEIYCRNDFELVKLAMDKNLP